jgi:hypothetical protein
MLIAVVYWLAVDGPRAATETRRREEIAAIVEQIPSRSRRVGAVDLSENEVLMLELQFDRPITPRKPGDLPSSDEWLVSRRQQHPDGPYRLTASTTSFALSRRGVDGGQRAPLAQ